MSARSRTRARWLPARRRWVAAAVAALLLLPHAAAADERDELDKTRRRLGAVETVLGDARAEAGAVADALAAADVAVAVAQARLAAATGELEAARRRRADALVALEAASDEVGRQEARLAWQVRRAYMTGGVSGLSVVVQASDLRDLMERAVTLGYVIRADQDVLGRLELARRRSVRLHAAMVGASMQRRGAIPHRPAGTSDESSRSVRAGSAPEGSTADNSGQERSPDVR
jgi:septal ring factor EnvC (AmiA/AmiB activator)